jgi:RNA:NAD 2'-phosphotransferase (TPT1/KptA family)
LKLSVRQLRLLISEEMQRVACDVPSLLYHVTPTENVEAIKREGLKAMTKRDYGPRVYVMTDKDAAMDMADWLGHSDEYALFEIDTTSLDDVEFFEDTEAPGCVSMWTTSPIPADALEFIETFEV